MRAEDPVSGHVADDTVRVSQRVPFFGRMWMNRWNWYSFAGPPSLPLGEMVIHWKSGAFPRGLWKHESVHLYLLTGLTTCTVAQGTSALCSRATEVSLISNRAGSESQWRIHPMCFSLFQSYHCMVWCLHINVVLGMQQEGYKSVGLVVEPIVMQSLGITSKGDSIRTLKQIEHWTTPWFNHISCLFYF